VKHLYLVRHAKSSWDYLEPDDFARPLNKRGMADAPKMGAYLAKRRISPQIIVTSPARRAHATAISLATALQFSPSKVMQDEQIYAASTSTLLAIIQAWGGTWERAMMVGHNPSIADVAAVLTGEGVGHVSTCTVMELDLDVASWSDVAPDCGVLRFRHSPRNLA